MAPTATLDAAPVDSLFAHVPQQPARHVVPLDLAPTLTVDRDAMIDAIMKLNRGATRAWLDRFGDAALRDYLAHLQAAATPRGRFAIWVRTSHAPAITVADAPE